MTIGERIIEIMKNDGVSQTELAKRMGINRKSLHQTLKINQDIKYSQVEKMLEKLGYELKIEEQL